MTLQRCQLCRRLTVANFCSSCQAGMSGQVDRDYLYVLQHEETRLGMQAMLGPVRERVDTINAQVAADAMRADPRYLGPPETWPQPEGARNMTQEERAETEGDARRNVARGPQGEALSPYSLPAGYMGGMGGGQHPVDRLPARLRRWLQGAP